MEEPRLYGGENDEKKKLGVRDVGLPFAYFNFLFFFITF